MADYYTLFLVDVPLKPEQRQYAMDLDAHVQAYRSDDTPLPDDFPPALAEVIEDWTFETLSHDEGVRLGSQNGGQEAACAFIQHLLQQFDCAPYVTFEWSHDCSRPRADAYGGGAAYITATEIETFSSSEWLQKVAA